jgi:hypothetical protein
VGINEHILALTSVPFRPTTAQMSNLTLIETKRIKVCYDFMFYNRMYVLLSSLYLFVVLEWCSDVVSTGFRG